MKRILASIAIIFALTMPCWAQYPGPQGPMMFSSNCAASPQFGLAAVCYDTTNEALYYWTGTAFSAGPNSVTVGKLPTCGTGQTGLEQYVTDSTTVSAEGQTCAGSSTHPALAICIGTTWKCF